MTDHPMDCLCLACMDEAFGRLDALPPDLEEQRDAALDDRGVPTVGPDEC